MIYETCVILNAQLTDEEIDAQVEKVKEPLIKGGAEMVDFSRWGKRKLAYEINKSAEGFYVVYYYKLSEPGNTLVEFERACGYDDNVLRVMTTKVPEKKKGKEIRPLVPSPGYQAEFSMKLRAQGPRRRMEGGDRGGRYGGGRYGSGPPRPAAPDKAADKPTAEAAASSPAPEAKPPETPEAGPSKPPESEATPTPTSEVKQVETPEAGSAKPSESKAPPTPTPKAKPTPTPDAAPIPISEPVAAIAEVSKSKGAEAAESKSSPEGTS